MSRLMLLLVLVLVPSMVLADGAARVQYQSAAVSGTVIAAAAPVTKAAAAAVTNTDALYMTPSEQHSVEVMTTVTGAVSITVGVQYLCADGTSWSEFTPAVSQVFSLAALTPNGCAALSIPVRQAIRFTLSSDASKAVVYNAVVLGRY